MGNLVDQSHEVSIRPASLVQVIGLLQHLGQLLASNIPGRRILTRVSFTSILWVLKFRSFCNVSVLLNGISVELIFPMFWKHFKEFWTFGWIHPDNFWLPTDLTVAVGTGIDLNFDSMNKKGLFVAKFSKKLFYVRFSLWLFALILVFTKYFIKGPCLFIYIKNAIPVALNYLWSNCCRMTERVSHLWVFDHLSIVDGRSECPNL